jgi:hypothetical protein
VAAALFARGHGGVDALAAVGQQLAAAGEITWWRIGAAAYDSVAPGLLIGWAEVGPWCLRSFHALRAGHTATAAGPEALTTTANVRDGAEPSPSVAAVAAAVPTSAGVQGIAGSRRSEVAPSRRSGDRRRIVELVEPIFLEREVRGGERLVGVRLARELQLEDGQARRVQAALQQLRTRPTPDQQIRIDAAHNGTRHIPGRAHAALAWPSTAHQLPDGGPRPEEALR